MIVNITPFFAQNVHLLHKYVREIAMDYIRSCLMSWNMTGVVEKEYFRMDYDSALQTMERLQHMEGTRGAVHDVRFMKEHEYQLRRVLGASISVEQQLIPMEDA